MRYEFRDARIVPRVGQETMLQRMTPPLLAHTDKLREAVKVITPSLIMVGIVTGFSMAIGSALGHALVAVLKKK